MKCHYDFRHDQEHNKPKMAYADYSTLRLRVWGIWGCCEGHFHAPPRALVRDFWREYEHIHIKQTQITHKRAK